MRRSTSMTPQSVAGSDVCPLQEPESEIVLEFRTVAQASPLSLSAGVSLHPLAVEDPRRSASHVARWRRAVCGWRAPTVSSTHDRCSGTRAARSWSFLVSLAERLAAVGRNLPVTVEGVNEIVLTEPAQGMIRCGENGKIRGANRYGALPTPKRGNSFVGLTLSWRG